MKIYIGDHLLMSHINLVFSSLVGSVEAGYDAADLGAFDGAHDIKKRFRFVVGREVGS